MHPKFLESAIVPGVKSIEFFSRPVECRAGGRDERWTPLTFARCQWMVTRDCRSASAHRATCRFRLIIEAQWRKASTHHAIAILPAAEISAIEPTLFTPAILSERTYSHQYLKSTTGQHDLKIRFDQAIVILRRTGSNSGWHFPRLQRHTEADHASGQSRAGSRVCIQRLSQC